jgi:CRISPR-associated protein Cmr3
MMKYLFIRPVDVLYLRGNRLFGGPGDHGDVLMPPWPSLFAGAIRSRILVDRNVHFTDFLRETYDDQAVREVLGSPEEPGTFRVTSVSLARDGGGKPGELYFPLPADVFVPEEASGRNGKPGREAIVAEPIPLADLAGVETSSQLPCLQVLRLAERVKGQEGLWMTGEGLAAYLRGEAPAREHLVPRTQLWATESRLGIALDPGLRTAEEGRLYTTDTVAAKDAVGFLVGVDGADSVVPKSGLLRLGGDGRGAAVSEWELPEPPPWRYVPSGETFRIVLSTPGIFPGGWLPPGVRRRGEEFVLEFRGLRARLEAATVPRHEVISGWDVANHRPKPALRVVPAGTVYQFRVMEGDPSALRSLLDEGLWPLMEGDATAAELQADLRLRRSEGFNNVWLADGSPSRARS